MDSWVLHCFCLTYRDVCDLCIRGVRLLVLFDFVLFACLRCVRAACVRLRSDLGVAVVVCYSAYSSSGRFFCARVCHGISW